MEKGRPLSPTRYSYSAGDEEDVEMEDAEEDGLEEVCFETQEE